ncbi:MAG TPA: hypothetical protein VL361_28380 [Candidatus Limnocylindrales bacterium]|nr:hypothetical protein [Candidatus Limnocylindrales bacterium]
MSHRRTSAGTRRLRFRIAVVALWGSIVVLGMFELALQYHKSFQSISTATQPNEFRARGGNWYFRTEQWRADARTLVAAARWCFEPAPPYATNLGSAPAPANTNRAVVAPS